MKNGKHGSRARFERSGGSGSGQKPGGGRSPGGPGHRKSGPDKPGRFDSGRSDKTWPDKARPDAKRFDKPRGDGPKGDRTLVDKPRFDKPRFDKRPGKPNFARGGGGADRRPNFHDAGGGKVWLYGIHPVLAALANPRRKILQIAIQREVDAQLGPRLETLAEAHPLGLPDAEILDREQLDRMLPRGAVHQGLAALVQGLDDPDLDDIIRATEGQDAARVVVLDQVTDPHNVGAILRSCAGFGVAAVICPERHSPGATAVMAKAASGALERVPFVRVVNLARALEHLKKAGYWCVGLAGEAQTQLHEADMTGKIALIVGAEGEGLRRLTRENCDLLVRIPIDKGVESLNVSNAAAIALYELQRRAAVAL